MFRALTGHLRLAGLVQEISAFLHNFIKTPANV